VKLAVMRAELGEIKEKTLVDGDFNKVLKDIVIKALELWDPQKSDLIIMRHKQEINVKLPISKEQYELYSQYNLRRKGDYAAFEIPVYLISFENEWIDDSIFDSKVFVVAPYIDDYCMEKVEELARSITTLEKEEESIEEE
jgi:hypothetical protein